MDKFFQQPRWSLQEIFMEKPRLSFRLETSVLLSANLDLKYEKVLVGAWFCWRVGTLHKMCMQGERLNGEKYKNGLKGGVKISPAIGG